MGNLQIVLALAALLCVVVAVVLFRRRRGELRAYEASEAFRSPEGVEEEAAERAPGAEPAPVPGGLAARVRGLFQREATPDTWRQLEDVLIRADVGPTAAADLVARVRADHRPGSDAALLLRDEVIAVLGPDRPLALAGDRLAVILVVGVNGSGKTTTIGKLAVRLGHDGRKVSLAASDTFRAAAGEQLEVWAGRAGAHLVAQGRGADPGAVAFDAVTSALARGSDVLIVDTAGRLHTKMPLMDELGKVRRVIEKAGGEVDETLLVLDATTGQNGIAQARAFTEAVAVTGVVLSKTDGTAKGGIVLAVREELGVPIRYLGVGEAPQDLRPFEAAAFADRLLGI
ncbi:MAG: signal recognition particle-docking protein FtsY [Actinomycetota bacterium]